ncbi:hypothetical protein LIER_35680 [Lithospermum erythrorhizon]|uniref:Uncharacterized protein n=1 Tax=Lithospermum erythrorhizon TaxID=34254 RepID=A0AAV3NVU3_LITER
MDLSLWDAPVVEVAEDSHFYIRNDWYRDIHFGYGQDVIEEEAMNTTSCMQVLKILLAKADAESMQIEDNISVLEASLSSANMELSDLCSVIRERTDCLEESIQSCKDVCDEHDCGLQLQSHTESPNRVHEITKSLPCEDMEHKNEQFGSATVIIPSIQPGLVGKKEDSTQNSESHVVEKRIEDLDSLDKGVNQNPHDKPQHHMGKNPEVSLNVNHSSYFLLATLSMEEKQVHC